MPRNTVISYTVAALCLATALAIYGYGFVRSPLVNPDIRAQRELLAHYATQSTSPDEIRALANAYWRRNPDVVQDQYYGRNGKMGIFGAREHFEQHGRKEGRRWGL